MRAASRAAVRAAIGTLLVSGIGTWPARAQEPPAAPPKAEVPACADCHDEAKVFQNNAHGRAQGDLTGDALCAGCHGDGAKHAEAGGDAALIRKVRGPEGSKTCVTCHGGGTETGSYRGSVHAKAGTDCLTCHSIHAADPKAQRLLVRGGTALCATCHQSTTTFMKGKPFAHRLDRARLQCVTCHDPHARSAAASVRIARTGEMKCLNCHAEKRGPFVFEHVSDVAGDCTSCHETHGSSNPKQLKRAQVHLLCLECHSTLSAATLGAQPPSTHNVRLPRWQSCTTCHVAVHGSNRSPRLLK